MQICRCLRQSITWGGVLDKRDGRGEWSVIKGTVQRKNKSNVADYPRHVC